MVKQNKILKNMTVRKLKNEENKERPGDNLI